MITTRTVESVTCDICHKAMCAPEEENNSLIETLEINGRKFHVCFICNEREVVRQTIAFLTITAGVDFEFNWTPGIVRESREQ